MNATDVCCVYFKFYCSEAGLGVATILIEVINAVDCCDCSKYHSFILPKSVYCIIFCPNLIDWDTSCALIMTYTAIGANSVFAFVRLKGIFLPSFPMKACNTLCTLYF